MQTQAYYRRDRRCWCVIVLEGGEITLLEPFSSKKVADIVRWAVVQVDNRDRGIKNSHSRVKILLGKILRGEKKNGR
jgi:hypothetical protein